jgi:TatD DNase family protein
LRLRRLFVAIVFGMGLIDTHTHLESFVRQGTLPAALDRASKAGVDSMITIGTSPDDWRLYRTLATERPGVVHYTVGLHPCSVDADWERAVAGLEEFWEGANRPGQPRLDGDASPHPVALGECGLDRFHLPKDPTRAEEIFTWQRRAFAAQLEMARRLGCPVVVHSRGAFRECVEMIDASGVKWGSVVFHCFTEGEPEMAELMQRGGVGSFTGILTYKTAEAVRAAAMMQGLSRFMVETDAPYLAPMPHRGKPNEPAFVRHTAEFAAAEVFGVSYAELDSKTTGTARRFFGI